MLVFYGHMYIDDPLDVSLRPTRRESYDQTTDRHVQVKTLLYKRLDSVIDQLQDPHLTVSQQNQLFREKDEIKADIASIRVGGSEQDYLRLRDKYRHK